MNDFKIGDKVKLRKYSPTFEIGDKVKLRKYFSTEGIELNEILTIKEILCEGSLLKFEEKTTPSEFAHEFCFELVERKEEIINDKETE
jgi:hypothetical protein